MKKLTVLIFLMISNFSFAQTQSYVGYTYKSLTFENIGEDSSAIDYDDSGFQTLDFTLSIGDNMFFGVIADLDQDQERSRNILVKFGLGDWGASVESGKIAGRFKSDSDLDYQPIQNEFEYDYQGFKLYSYDSWNSKSGITYAKWSQPSKVVVNLDFDDSYCATRVCEVSWIDPEVEYMFFGYYMANQLMERLAGGAEYESGFNSEVFAEIGYMTIEPSDANITRVNNDVDSTVSADSLSGFASRSTFQLGYYGLLEFDKNSGLAWGVGYEVSLTGIILGGRSTSEEDYVVTPNQLTVGHGVYLKAMMAF